MIGGTAYAVGKNSMRNRQREADEEARIETLEQQASAPSPAKAPDLTSKLTELKGLLDEGALTPDEFAAAKQKLLAG